VTLQQALTLARKMLAVKMDIENPSLEAEILLRHALQISRVHLHLDLDKELGTAKEQELRQMVERKIQGEPIAYITGYREFYGLDFGIDSRVLIPRPESELLVEEAIRFRETAKKTIPLFDKSFTIADIGTGSGAVAVSLAVNWPFLSEDERIASGGSGARNDESTLGEPVRISATDISASALEVARINCQKHRVSDRVTLLQGDLLEPLPTPTDIIIANLPYVRKADIATMPSGTYEPALALDGGESGLDKIFRLCRQLGGKLSRGGCLLLEIGMGQSPAVTELLHQLYPASSIQVIPDLAGISRVVKMVLQ